MTGWLTVEPECKEKEELRVELDRIEKVKTGEV
jgi:hypothetical protein